MFSSIAFDIVRDFSWSESSFQKVSNIYILDFLVIGDMGMFWCQTALSAALHLSIKPKFQWTDISLLFIMHYLGYLREFGKTINIEEVA